MGLKVTLSGDLWSSHGTALFGLVMHGITKDWEMKELLAGAIPARLDPHTGEWVITATEEALKNIDIHRALRDNGSIRTSGQRTLARHGRQKAAYARRVPERRVQPEVHGAQGQGLYTSATTHGRQGVRTVIE